MHEHFALSLLSDIVQELDDHAAGTAVIQAERAFLRTGCIPICNLFLRTPENSLIVGMRFRDISEWAYCAFRFRLAFISPDKSHDLTACTGLIDAELALLHAGSISGRYALLLCPQNCFVESMRFRDI